MADTIPFVTVVGPLAYDLADGVKAFNNIASTHDNNFVLLSNWAEKSLGVFSYSDTFTGSAVASPASGYALYSNTYARKWGAVTFVQLRVQRIGANVAVLHDGNVGDHTLATLGTAWRPVLFQNVTASAVGNAGPFAINVVENGEVRIAAVNESGGTVVKNDIIEVAICFTNNDSRPI